MNLKDNFSTQSKQYAKFRPTYPEELYQFLLSHVVKTQVAWDCATGNGQIATVLSQHFDNVYATDISENQLKNAPQIANITYKVERAEYTSFQDHSFDLITVGQAIHWFKFDAFYTEVKRTLKPNGLIAIVGYGIMHINAEIDELIHYLYKDILGSFWDEERKYIEDNYLNVTFPFREIQCPGFEITAEWNLEQLIGYLETWSALQHYIKLNSKSPIPLIYERLEQVWGNTKKHTIHFPILLKVGKP